MAATILTLCFSKAISEAGTLPEQLSSAHCWTNTFSGAINFQLQTRDKSGFARATLTSAPPLTTRADGLTAWGSQSEAHQIISPTSRKATTGNTKQAIPTVSTYMVFTTWSTSFSSFIISKYIFQIWGDDNFSHYILLKVPLNLLLLSSNRRVGILPVILTLFFYQSLQWQLKFFQLLFCQNINVSRKKKET